RPYSRIRYRLAAEQDLAGLRQLIGAEDAPYVVHVDASGLHQAPVFLADRITDPEFVLPPDRSQTVVRELVGDATITMDGGRVCGEAPTVLDADSAPRVQVALVNSSSRSSAGPRFQEEFEASARSVSV